MSTVLLECPKHGVVEHRLRKDRKLSYRCTKCNTANVDRHRKKKKQTIIDEMGGGCILCGYDRYIGALEFHHRDPALKAFEFGRKNWASSLKSLREEAKKCVLLCSNCHREVEAGIVSL